MSKSRNIALNDHSIKVYSTFPHSVLDQGVACINQFAGEYFVLLTIHDFTFFSNRSTV